MKLFYRQFGTGTPLLILHGLFGMSDYWIPVAQILSKDFHLIVPDLRNHGRSPHCLKMDYESMRADIIALLEELRLSKINLLGHSMGGKLAMSFALKYRERVERLIVVDVGIKAFDISDEVKNIITIAQNIDLNAFSSRNELSKYISCPLRVKDMILKNIKQDRNRTLSWKPNIQAIVQNLPNVPIEITSENTFQGKTLFLKGEYSDYTADEDIPAIQETFPNSRVVIIPNAGHWLHVDNQKGFLQCIMDFLC
ncbi:MAG: alpha/beta fold hydrolase [Bacteroidales bacterium]|jgi:pimeloyl-ACP methyl ester carboxylesterase|nr:alpha/beta fold hydrolase [Bacteroidales bacterium]